MSPAVTEGLTQAMSQYPRKHHDRV